jgi:hypothetical protein
MKGLEFPDTPTVINDLVDLLVARGFERQITRTGGMGGFYTVLRGPTLNGSGPDAEVEITADRGEWTIGLKMIGMARFIDLSVWNSYLHGSAISDLDLVSEARFVAGALDEAARAVAEHGEVEGELRALDREYVRDMQSNLHRNRRDG